MRRAYRRAPLGLARYRACSTGCAPSPDSVFNSDTIRSVVGSYAHVKCVSAVEVFKTGKEGGDSTQHQCGSSLTLPSDPTTPELVRLKPSSNPASPPSVYFVAPTASTEPPQPPSYVYEVPRDSVPELLYKISSPTCDYVATRIALLKAGFKRIPLGKLSTFLSEGTDATPSSLPGVDNKTANYSVTPPNVIWGKSISLNSGHPVVKDPLATDSPIAAALANASEMTVPFQRFNHFPKGHLNLGCKEGLARNLATWGDKVRRQLRRNQQSAAGSSDNDTAVPGEVLDAGGRTLRSDVDSFYPKTYFYPNGEEELKAAMLSNPQKKYIWKPSRGSCGRGILLVPGGSERHFNETKRQIARYRERAHEIMDGAKVCEADEPITGVVPAPLPASKSSSAAAARGASLANPRMFDRYVVQEYLANPLLIEGRKFDLRLYVVVTRYFPFTVAYRHEVGFARFAASNYNEDGGAAGGMACDDTASDSRYAYLTNFSVGRKLFAHKTGASPGSPDGQPPVPLTPEEEHSRIEAIKAAAERAGELKWTLDYLNHVLKTRPSVVGVREGSALDVEAMWKEVDTVICSTLEAVRQNIGTQFDPSRRRPVNDARDSLSSASLQDQAHFADSYFELYGFDIMFDDSCKPWLIEVNTLPSLESSSLKDYYAKGTVVSDLLNIVQVTPFERTAVEEAPLAQKRFAPREDKKLVEGRFHSVEDRRRSVKVASQPSSCDDVDVSEALRCRLRDEARDAGGFRRITPHASVVF